jgi:hypothetical protein
MDIILAKINSRKELLMANKDEEENWTEVTSRGKKLTQNKQTCSSYQS